MGAYLYLKCTKIRLVVGLCPEPLGGGLCEPPDPLSTMGPKGEVPISKGDGREGKRVTPKVQLSSIKH